MAGTIPDGATRQVSLHDPDARPIAKGRLGKPVEFGKKAQVCDNADGIVLDGELVELGYSPAVAAHRCHPAPPAPRCATTRPCSANETLITRKPRSPTDFLKASSRPASGRAGETEIASTGAANLVRNAVTLRFGADLAMLGRDDGGTDLAPPSSCKAAPVGREGFEPSRGVFPAAAATQPASASAVETRWTRAAASCGADRGARPDSAQPARV